MIHFNRRKVIKLNKMDAAIVLTEDGTVEASLPEIQSETVPENVLIGAAVVFALTNPELCKIMRDHFLHHYPQSIIHKAINDDKAMNDDKKDT
jgi:hypothetical protein